MIEARFALRLGIVNLWGDDNIIIHDGTVEFYDIDSGDISQAGQVLFVWKKDGGEWRIFRDVYKSNWE